MLTEAQLAARKGKATSSIVGAVLGVDPFRSPLMAYHLIRGENDKLPPPSPMLARAAARGHRLESIALDYGAEVMGWERVEADMVTHGQWDWCADNIDCLYSDPTTGEVVAGGEAKTVAMGGVTKWGTPGTDECPHHVVAQCQWHMMHHGVNLIVVPVLVGGYDFSFRHYVVNRNDALIGVIFDKVRAFMDAHVRAGVPPPASELDHDLLRGWYPEAEPEGIEATPEIEAAAEAKIHWRSARKAAEAAEKLSETQLYEALGTAEAAHSALYKVTWRNNKDSEKTDWQTMAMDLGATPQDIAKHTQVKPGPRVLRVDHIKKQKAAQ